MFGESYTDWKKIWFRIHFVRRIMHLHPVANVLNWGQLQCVCKNHLCGKIWFMKSESVAHKAKVSTVQRNSKFTTLCCNQSACLSNRQNLFNGKVSCYGKYRSKRSVTSSWLKYLGHTAMLSTCPAVDLPGRNKPNGHFKDGANNNQLSKFVLTKITRIKDAPFLPFCPKNDFKSCGAIYTWVIFH